MGPIMRPTTFCVVTHIPFSYSPVTLPFMLLLRRLLPFLVAILSGVVLSLQSRSPETYPWLGAIAPVVFACAGLFVSWKRIPLAELVSRILPSVLALAAMTYGLLLAEGWLARFAIPFGGALVSYVALELLFLLTFLPARYPTNGLSHFNLSLVPGILFLAQNTSVGLTMFVHESRVIPILVLAGAAAALFWSTAHVEANAAHRRRWSAIGAWLGAHVGLLGAFLPVQVSLHGACAALLGTLALRARRYGISPLLPRSLVLAEVLGGGIFLAAMLGTARWV